MITVIADDLTGAAEIAGAAFSHGLKTTLTIGCADIAAETDVWVIATDTRSESEEAAISTVSDIAKRINAGQDGVLFKKTDSVLRGHVAAELTALMAATGYEKALLLPQNPSRGRTIKGGTYYIGGTPLHLTPFNRDPEYPAQTSDVTGLIGSEAIVVPPEAALPYDAKGIIIAEADSEEQVKEQLLKADRGCILAGGADFFAALLQKTYPETHPTARPSTPISPRPYTIMACGSTQSTDISHTAFAAGAGLQVAEIPEDVFHGAPYGEWITSLPARYSRGNAVAVSVGSREDGGPQCAERLRHIMAEAVKTLAEKTAPDLLIIEGGATAYAIINALGMSSFTVTAEYAAGIVGMNCGKTEVIMKPGSYRWNGLL